MAFLIAILVGLISIILPGFFLSLALLRKTRMPMFEIVIIGFIFGLIFPPTLIWLESYLIPYMPIFTFSNTLYNINVVVLTLIGIALCIQQGAISKQTINRFTTGLSSSPSKFTPKQEMERDHKKRLLDIRQKLSSLNIDAKVIKQHEHEEKELLQKHQSELEATSEGSEERRKLLESHLEQERRLYEHHESEEAKMLNTDSGSHGHKSEKTSYVWLILSILMILAFLSRIANITVSPTYFEFDPYFDMVSTQYILVHGYQLLYEHSAWPSLVNGTIHRLQPLVPYLEAYWYNLAGPNPNATITDTNLLSLVSSFYPPISSALLVFVVFMFLYHEYGEFEGLVGAGLATAMPILFTTFIAGEQLLEPWGILALFFFYASYVLAVHNPEEKRYAILAGIAFSSNFLGAHYYTVPAGVLAFYITLQGVIHVLRGEDTKEFYKMNATMLAVVVFFFILYNAYSATLTERTPAILGVPVIVSFPIGAMLFVMAFEYIPKLLKKRGVMSDLRLNASMYLQWLAVIGILTILLIVLTPLGKPFQEYIALSKKFTTPSSPLFMTVQEYAPTGLGFNYGNGGFGYIGASIGGVPIIVFTVIALFVVLEFLAIYNRNSRSSILAVSAFLPLAVAGMIEVKYLPHFGVGYIIAIGAILGELSIYFSNKDSKDASKYLYYAGIFIVLLEAFPVTTQFTTAILNSNCNSLGNNQIGAVLYCNQVPSYWISATSWMRANVGPYGPRILSWWDYGDWINWFGNSNAVLRGDNSVASADYAAAAHYVLTSKEGINATTLQQYMNTVQAKYILFDDQLVPKWGALDFLACVHINQTSEQYALAQGKQYGQRYALGTSACEIKHDPAYIFIPISQSINNYCSFPNNSTLVALRGFLVVGQQPTNQTYCVPLAAINNGKSTYLLNANGSKTNILLSPQFFGGQTTVQGQPFINFMLLYAPNGKNGTITNTPSEFYNSTFYKGFFLGQLPGFKLAYPANMIGINYVNSSNPVVIYSSNNFTGSLPQVTPKPSHIKNNYTMPG